MGFAQTAALGAVVHSAGEEAVLVPVPPVPFPMHASVLVPVPASALVRGLFQFFCFFLCGFGPRGGTPEASKSGPGGTLGPLAVPRLSKGRPNVKFSSIFGSLWDAFWYPVGSHFRYRVPWKPSRGRFSEFFCVSTVRGSPKPGK